MKKHGAMKQQAEEDNPVQILQQANSPEDKRSDLWDMQDLPESVKNAFTSVAKSDILEHTDEEDWITVSGTPVPVEGGELQGEIGAKIEAGTSEAENAENEISAEETIAETPTAQTVFSATDANPNIPEMTKAAQQNHAKHLAPNKSYPGMSMDEYVAKSAELARSPVGGDIDGYRASNGSIVRYNKATNDWVRAHWSGVATMFKPNRGARYFNENKVTDGG